MKIPNTYNKLFNNAGGANELVTLKSEHRLLTLQPRMRSVSSSRYTFQDFPVTKSYVERQEFLSIGIKSLVVEFDKCLGDCVEIGHFKCVLKCVWKEQRRREQKKNTYRGLNKSTHPSLPTFCHHANVGVVSAGELFIVSTLIHIENNTSLALNNLRLKRK